MLEKKIIFIGIICILAVIIAAGAFTNKFVANNTTTAATTNLTGIVVNSGQSIQSAIDNAPIGSNIIVNPGTYTEPLNIDKNITLIANGTVNLSEVHINGTGTTLQGFILSGDYPVQLFNTNRVKILKNIIHSNLNGIEDSGTNINLLVEGNTIIGTNPLFGNNMAFEGVTNNAIIKNNALSGAQHGILFDKASTNNTVIGNTIVGNVQLIHTGPGTLDHEGTAIYTVDGSTNFQILNNNVSYERDGIALQQIGNLTGSGFVISGNICTNNMNAIWMTISNSEISNNVFTNNNEGVDITGTGNIIKSNIITNNKVVGIALTTKTSTDSNTVSDNTMSGNKHDFYTAGNGTAIGIK